MDFEKYCEVLAEKLRDIVRHKAPSLLRNADLTVNPHYLDRERHHVTFYGYFTIDNKTYQFFHLRIDVGTNEICVQRLAVSPHLRRIGIGSCVIDTLSELAYDNKQCISAFVGSYDFIMSGVKPLALAMGI